jgi:lipid II:glycine glycyltransferase (peptidoglycan interpeptide bridge formation enzyme)
MYLPKGPLLTDWKDHTLRGQIIFDLEDYAKSAKVIQMKIDPDLELGRGVPGEEGSSENPIGKLFLKELEQRGWLFSTDQIQFRNTVLVDLQQDEDQILARMKSKTRYNIRLSGRKGITVREGDEQDLTDLYQMYANTSVRGDFSIRSEEYYQTLWQTFMKQDSHLESDPVAQPLIAEYEGRMVAGAVIFKFEERAWYLHGMSLPEHSDKMAPHLIQWEGMRWAKSHGCKVYDMWGAPETFDESDSMWGVYRFKRGYVGEVLRTMGAWDYPARPYFYRLFTRWVPRVLNIMRWFGDRRTRRTSTKDPR